LALFALLALDGRANGQTGSVHGEQKISDTAGGLVAPLDSAGRFGLTAVALGDLDGDGNGDLLVGKEADNDGGVNRGACFVLFLDASGSVVAEQKLSATAGGFGGQLDDHDRLGAAVERVPELDQAGGTAVAIGAIFDADGGTGPNAHRGAVWIVTLESDGTVRDEHKLSMLAGGFGGELADDDWFGVSIANLGDLDGDGPSTVALAVGALNDDDGGNDRGAVWIMFLDAHGDVLSEVKLSALSGGFSGPLSDGDHFGRKVSALGDLDGDGVNDLAVGAPGTDDGGPERGAVWILFLERTGSVRSATKLSAATSSALAGLDDGDRFGRGLGTLADLDCDGTVDLVVGATGDDDGGTSANANRGAAWIVFMAPDGTARDVQKISATSGGFTGVLDDVDVFGSATRGIHDVDGDGVRDLAVGAIGDDDGGADHGALWILFLRRAPAVGIGTPYCCPAIANSSAASATITALGSATTAADDLQLVAAAMPPQQFGYFLASRSQALVAQPGASTGVLCLGNPLGRFQAQVQNSGPLGTFAIDVDLTAIPLLGPVAAGERWNFQCWYRDVGGTSNFTDAVSILFE